MRRRLGIPAAACVAVCGFLLALYAPAAGAWDWSNLPNGYSIRDLNLPNGCHQITISGTLIGSNCDAGFQAALDAYVDSTICQVNPAAGGARCVTTTQTTAATSTTPSTTSPGATTTTTPAGTTVQVTTTVEQPPAPQPTGTTTVVVTVVSPSTTTVVTVTTPASPDNDTRLTLIEQRLAVLEARVQVIEAQVGQILGEPKNEPPFTSPA